MTVKKMKRYIHISNLVIGVLVVLVLGMNSFYVIQAQEQAVVVTLGKADVVTTSGLHLKIPFLQRVEIVPTVINGFNIGFANDYANTTGYNYNWSDYQAGMVSEDGSIQSESMMITSDYNFVNVDFFLEYQVSDPERYLFASDDPEFILRSLALSYIRDTIGLHEVDEVITTGKSEIQLEIKDKLTARLEEENIGLQLINITIQDAEPPTTEVINAFKEVESAKQGMETAINNARKYESEQLPAARAQEDSILKGAEAEKEARISDAKAQVAVFNAMYEEYRKNPAMTRQRMFYETMEELLPTMKIIIDDGSGNTNRVLPLDSFSQSGGTAATGSSASRSGNTANSVDEERRAAANVAQNQMLQDEEE